MEDKHKLILAIALASLSASTAISLLFFCLLRRRTKDVVLPADTESAFGCKDEEPSEIAGDLIKFHGGENLSAQDILEAPGEVIGKSSYGTVYRACLEGSNSIVLLRFLRPTCTPTLKEVMPIVELLGSVRHPNLVPLNAFYAGPRGEILMVHPFYENGNLAHFIRDGNPAAQQWPTIYRIAAGVARGIHHLHVALTRPLAHGNLKSKNILLGLDDGPIVSDYGLHLLVSPSAGQRMLEASASDGYKPPELIKIREAREENDVYSLGIIFLELVTAADGNPALDREDRVPRSEIFAGLSGAQRASVEDSLSRFLQLATACCSQAGERRPNMKQVVDVLVEIGE